jgi:hypothetical protein
MFLSWVRRVQIDMRYEVLGDNLDGGVQVLWVLDEVQKHDRTLRSLVLLTDC